MADNQLRPALDAIRTHLQAQLESQLEHLAAQHDEALANVRREAETEAEQRWTSKVEAVRAEWSSRLESEVAAARTEAERRMVAESMRLRVEAEQAAAESTARAREELEHALSAERQRAETQVEAERQRAVRELEAERERLSGQAADQAQSALTDARAAERQSQLAASERLLESVRSISSASSLSAMLNALVQAAGAESARAAVFVVNGRELQLVANQGFGGAVAPPPRMTADGILGEALRRGEPVSAATDRHDAPQFAALGPDRAALAVPLVAGDCSLGVLYADDAGDRAREAPAAWPEAIQILVRHASACIAYLTLQRTADALKSFGSHGAQGTGATRPQADVASDDENGARRYARLLVSEIKLYNEAAVRMGRQKRDLMERLRPEIERARRLYEERVPPAVGARGVYFQQELVQTLADGDSSLLGG